MQHDHTYDPLGNRLTKTSGATTTYYQYDAANQLAQTCADTGCTTVTGTFSYDLNGNLIQRTDGATAYAYDAENRLAAIAGGSLNETYAYDHQGRRVTKTSNGTTTHFLYNGPDILAEYATWTSPAARYTHGPKVDDPLLRATATGTQYYHQDGLGSVVSLSNPDGSSAATIRYDAWGTKLAGTGIPQYGYTGREPDQTGLIYYRARYYDPTLGRFTQRDPIGLQGGINTYAYARGNPVNLTDPLGLLPTNPLVASQATAAASPTDAPVGQTAAYPNLQAATGANGSNATEAVLLAAAGGLSSPDVLWGIVNDAGPEFTVAAAMPGAGKTRLSARDRAYLDKYYDPVNAQAGAYNVDPVLVLGVGIESGFASAGTYLRTGDAFGMTGGSTKNMTYASSPEENVRQFFSNYGEQIRGTGSNAAAFINGLQGRDPSGVPVPGWKVYNSENPAGWQSMIQRGIGQMQREVPIYLRQRSAQ